ncbi:Probable prolyl 4-hydroxylase [Seminavis robusta]|uniref:Probable prolyl 4-hydroxylase n=1 Tax=Seminavis robusta TaxID=568900 RepID=A0A9N8H3I3_9STRA|nr:Probable prolyl 4-hydroxylase [Seminavis robusta]|eukprot:Sro61_g035040.1 Probable prolyl 4-hydroxylase (510) ;mRNA; r:74729-76881
MNWKQAASILFSPIFFCQPITVWAELQCSALDGDGDPTLKEMTYDIGYGEQTFLAYVEPDVKTFYTGDPPASTKVIPKFDGLATKFINMSNKQVHLYWEPYEGGELAAIEMLEPFSATGTASHPGHIFVFADADKNILERVYIEEHPNNNYAYDPYFVEDDPEATDDVLQKELNEEEYDKYIQWLDTLNFSDQYLEFTGRAYIANYLRNRPLHHIWRADYFGQEHWVETRETHFEQVPPQEVLTRIEDVGSERIMEESQPRLLSEYRTPGQTKLNMTLKVLSVAPRVFEISNFLSPTEVDHILQTAGAITLGRSSIGDIGKGQDKSIEDSSISDTRTSLNSWISRETSPIFDAIYRRAADLMRIDEALLRDRGPDEYSDWPTSGSLAESLQLVHYDPGQKYTAHHDFGFSDLDDPNKDKRFTQATRFATLLLYLNSEGLEGGETTFPRWSNAESFDQLRVNPQEGKAVLFYSQLPDGNLDDFSQHAALPPREGEKWLMNLWVWDPKYAD